MTIDESRLIRQESGVDFWIDAGCMGTLEYCTGFGKTYSAVLICKRLTRTHKDRIVTIIVPKIQLKEQWEDVLKYNGIKNFKVYVINTLVQQKNTINTDLVILDECHRYASTEFIKIFDLVKYRFILGLSATLNRLDGRHELIEKYCPVCDTITQDEAKREGWISNFYEYNLGIELNGKDQARYKSLNGTFHKHFAAFGHDFHTAMSCCTKKGSEAYAAQYGLDAKQVAYSANSFTRAMRDRKEFLYLLDTKLDISVQIIDMFKVKTITFSESTLFADMLTDRLPGRSFSYHSNIKGKKIKTANLLAFKDSGSGIDIVNTAKSLDEGYDAEEIRLALINSSTTNPTQHTQRVGRAIRKFIDKFGVLKIPTIVNVYVKDSQDEKWLKERQKDPRTKLPINPDIVWIDRIDQIKI